MACPLTPGPSPSRGEGRWVGGCVFFETAAVFEGVNPFLDGNGRTGRLLLNLMLVRQKHPAAIIFKERRVEYLDGLRARDAGDPGPLGECIARALIHTLRRLVEFLNEHLDTVEVLAMELPQYVAPDAGIRALVPRLVGRTTRAEAVKGNRPHAKRQWDEVSFMEVVGDRLGSRALALCRAILEWCGSHGFRVEWGVGEHNGAMKAVVADAGAGNTPFTLFTLWTYGKIEIGFQQLKTRPPFTDEQLRMQLLDRLNAVPGVELPIASLGALPPI